MYTKRAELTAGFVVLAAIAALLGFLWYAGGPEPFWKSFRYVHVRFAQGTVAPRVGDAVQMNGVVVGRVHEVRQAQEIHALSDLSPEMRMRLDVPLDHEGPVRELFVLTVVKMPLEQIVPMGTTAQVGETLTGQRQFALRPGLSLQNLTDAQTHTAPIRGRESSTVDQLLGTVDVLVQKVGTFIDEGGVVLANVRDLLTTVQEKVAAIDVSTLNEEALAAIRSLRRTLGDVETRIGPILANVDAASGDLRTMMQSGNEAIGAVRADVQAITATLKDVARRVDEIVAKAAPRVEGILADVETMAANLNQASTQFAGIGPDVRRIVNDLGGDLDEIAKRLKDTAQNLVDVSEDLRSNPWKLANRPEDKEIAFENLRNSVLTWSRAMRDYEDAAARLQKLLARPDLDDAEIRTQLQEALAAFELSQQRMRRTEARFRELLFRSAPDR